MIKMVYDRGLYCEEIVCDACDKQIGDLREAAVYFTNDKEQPEYGHSYFAHRGNCSERVDRELYAMWIVQPMMVNLDRWLANLLYNTGIKTGEQFEMALKPNGL